MYLRGGVVLGCVLEGIAVCVVPSPSLYSVALALSVHALSRPCTPPRQQQEHVFVSQFDV